MLSARLGAATGETIIQQLKDQLNGLVNDEATAQFVTVTDTDYD